MLQPGGPAASLYLTLFGILASLVSTFWAFGYVRMSRKLRSYMHAGPGADVPRIRKVFPNPFLPLLAIFSTHPDHVIAKRDYTLSCAHRAARLWLMCCADLVSAIVCYMHCAVDILAPASAHIHTCRAAKQVTGLCWVSKF